MMQDERIVITGGTGLLGTALAAELREAGCSHVVQLSSIDADLTSTEQTEALFEAQRPSLVFHLAARVSGIAGNMKSQGQAFLDNIRMNTNVVEAARLVGARKVVALGTTATYSDLAPLPKREDDIWLGPPHASEAGYGHAKRALLAQLMSYQDQFGLDFAYCISTNLFGPNDKFDEQFGHVVPSLISKFYRAAKLGQEIEVWGSGTPQRDFLYSKDAARALRIIAQRGHGAINLVSGSTITIRECVMLIADIAGYTGPIRWNTSKPDGQMRREYDVRRLAALDFRPGFTMREALQETYDWYVSNVEQARR